jgi:hypothetical protein
MKRFARLSIGMIALAAMAFAVTLVPQKAAKGSGTDAVRVVNTPLPVTGTVHATLSGTPTVNIGKLPPVDVEFPSSLHVTNPTIKSQAVPLLTRDAGAMHAFQASCVVNYTGLPGTGCTITTVPAGKRLVIQLVSMQVKLDAGLRVPLAELEGASLIFLPSQFTGTTVDGFDVSVSTQQITMYVDSQFNVFCGAAASGVPTAASNLACSIMGYMVDVP